METLSAVVTVCSICRESLNAKGECLACLLRGGLDEPAEEAVSFDSLGFGDFEIARREDGSCWELGRGAMGVTYLAVDKVLHRNVALKVIETPAAAGDSRAVRERFLREARAAATLRHPNVAGVFQFGASADANRCYYAMELVEGETLEALVRRDGPLKVGLALEIAIQVTRALTAAAAQGLIHRDLKPGNIMITRPDAATAEMEVKVIDFGLAKATNAVLETDLTHGGFVGTPSFASPEQFGSAPADARSDIYSLGVTLWYALTGQVPYPGKTIEEIRDRQQHTDLPVEQLAERKIPASLIDMLRRILALDPTQRPASARELMEALESCRAKLAHRSGIRTFRRLAALIVVLAIAAVALFALRQNRQKTTSTASNKARPPVSMLAPLPEKSIAVLPFENLSDEKQNAFLSDGVQEEILIDLAKVAALKVISRTSVMQYKTGAARNLREIAKTLGVSHVVEGSVQRAGDRIRVTAQLIDARTDSHLWAEHYDRQIADVFAIQSEIAQQIANQLQARLSPEEKIAISEQPTTDLEAYALYTEARTLSSWDNRQGAERSMARKVDLLEEATQRDPKFVLAWCALAKVQDDFFGTFGDPEHLELAKKAVDIALRLRPDLGETHRELARHYFYANDYDRAYYELALARRTLPNDSEALSIAGRMDRHKNRWDASLVNLQKARELDPRNGEIAYHLWQDYRYLRRYDLWKHDLERDVAAEGPGAWAQLGLAELKLDQGDLLGAQAALAQLPQDWSPTFEVWETRFTTALYLHDYDAANQVIAATPAKFADAALGGQPPQSWADGLVARARGDEEKAQAVFSAARKRADVILGNKVKDENYFTQIATLDAALGRKDEAIREARRAVDLLPITKDSYFGSRLVTNLAMVYAQTGERDLAIEELESLAKIPGGPSYGSLRFNPCWDSLRGDPRFEKIVASLAPKGASNTTSTASALTPLPEKSIAVLPFKNLSAEKNDAFFADGIQDDVLTSLATIKELKVISHTSVMAYRDDGARNTRQIGQTLGVANVLEGSVRRVGHRVAVNVQLIDTRTDRHLWAKHYDRTLTDSLGLQGELANEIATTLRATLSPQEKARVAAKPTNNPAAYDAYLRGRAFAAGSPFDKPTVDGAIHSYQEAVKLDPNFALAWAYLSFAQSGNYWLGFDSSPARLAAAKDALDRALVLDPNLPQTHLALGYYRYYAQRDFAGALAEFQQAEQGLPNNVDVIRAIALIQRRVGHWDEAIVALRRAVELDPRNIDAPTALAITYRCLRRFPEALATADRVLALEPTNASALWTKAGVFWATGDLKAAELLLLANPRIDPGVRGVQALFERRYAAAIEILSKATVGKRDKELTAPLFILGLSQQRAGDVAAAHATYQSAVQDIQRQLDKVARDSFQEAELRANLGRAYAGLGEAASAIAEGQKAMAMHPTSKDPLEGPAEEERMALIYALLGDADHAIPILKRLLQIPSGAIITLALLRLDPIWDQIRNDPRFQELAAEKTR